MGISTANMSIFNGEKIGNLFIYLADNVDNLFLTKLLKLTYIIDETAVKEVGSPVTWLNYKVWKNGPVPQKVYYNLRLENGTDFSEYVKVEHHQGTGGKKIVSVSEFDDSEFSDYEIELMDRVIAEYGGFNSTQLIDMLHNTDSLWHKVVVEKELQAMFDAEDELNTSPYDINLKEAISEPYLQSMFEEMSDSIAFRKTLVSH